MIFDIITAQKLVDHYKPILIGRPIMENEAPTVTEIIITPSDTKRFKVFVNAIASNGYKAALIISGYDKNDVLIKLMDYDYPNLIRRDLDKYLTKNNIKKVYHVDAKTKKVYLNQ
jgi:hypothetical protein